jgi:hypothetical protein
MDQWAMWRTDTKYGTVYISITPGRKPRQLRPALARVLASASGDSGERWPSPIPRSPNYGRARLRTSARRRSVHAASGLPDPGGARGALASTGERLVRVGALAG